MSGPPVPRSRPTLLDRFLPWPVRLAFVAAAAAIGFIWASAPAAEQVGGLLQLGGLIAVSLSVSFWWLVLSVDAGLAVLWLWWPAADPATRPYVAAVHSGLTFVNRQMAHVEVFAVWVVLAVVSADRLTIQFPFVVGVLLLGEPLLDLVANELTSGSSGRDLHWRRRPFIYAATALGLVAIALVAPRQWTKLVPGVLALVLAVAVRAWRHVLWSRAMAKEEGQGLRAAYHEQQVRWGRRWDAVLGPVLVTGCLCLAVALSAVGRRAYDSQLLPSDRGEPVDQCTATSPSPEQATLALFLVSDSQFHELRGRRFVGQMALADAIVPVALRPLELDVLSAAPLWHFGSVRKSLEAQRGAPLPWAHLGDMADLSCKDEMDRAVRLLHERYDPAELVGIAPGNHDKAFTGNFVWSPYWDSACPSGRMEKPASDELLADGWRRAVVERQGRMQEVPPQGLVSALTRQGGALVTASPMGKVRYRGVERGVVAVFLDTSDGAASDMGVAGAFGTFSQAQAEAATRTVGEVANGAGYDGPLYLVFLHHPLGEMEGASGARLRAWLRERDGERGGPNVVGLVAAHTHEAQRHAHCIGERVIPEIVVGSTIDAPQEAALLELGPAPEGTIALRVLTLPSVARPASTCHPPVPLLTAHRCQVAMAKLVAEPSCAALFGGTEAGSIGRDCSAIEHPRGPQDRIRQALFWTGPGDQKQVREDQLHRAASLWRCLCRDGALCSPDAGALALDDDRYFDLLEHELRSSPEREEELTCLAWAAASVQTYKSAGMSYADALRCSFDDENIAPARDFVARMEVVPCHEQL